jgi:tetratricopeptide (TPR) repeat protein
MVADHYLQDGNAASAARVVENALRRNPQSSMLLHAKGAILKYQGDLAGAKRAFQDAFAADTLGNLKPICAFKAGDVAMQQQDYAGAVEWFRTATDLAPRTVGYHGALARALRAQGRIAEAEEQEKAERDIETYIRDTANSL